MSIKILCPIPQFKTPLEVRQWFLTHVKMCSKCQLKKITRKVKEQLLLKNKKKELIEYKNKKIILDLELDEYLISSANCSVNCSPRSCTSQSNCSPRSCTSVDSTKAVSEGFEFIDLII